ncbi:hypothetical protein [Ferruginibacter sp.]
MKMLLSITTILLFISCNNFSKTENTTIQPPEKSKINVIKLADSFGTVSISLPLRYDTNFSWTHHSDCGSPCDKIKYRFQPKSLPIIEENGWMWSDLKDSIERFTIVHSAYVYPFNPNSDTAYLRKQHAKKKAELLIEANSYKIKSDTIEKIDDYYFSIFLIDLYDSTKLQYSKKVLAGTYIKNNSVEFNFELLTKQKDSLKDKFLDNSLYFLKTIRIEN